MRGEPCAFASRIQYPAYDLDDLCHTAYPSIRMHAYMPAATRIFDRLSALADGTRSRLLLVLEGREMTVSELCRVLQLPQSTVSRHLRVLADEGWVLSRAEGTSRLYAMEPGLDAQARRLWGVVRDQAASLPDAEQDARRTAAVLAQRRTAAQAFFSSAAGEWDRMRHELFGRRSELLPLLALIDGSWTIGDLGCGTGQVAAALSPFVARVIAVDDSAAMLAEARRRLDGAANVELRSGDLTALPIEDGALDAAILSLVLPYLPEPAVGIAEAARTIRPEGRLVIVDMLPHDRAEYRQRMGHVWQGFSGEQMAGWLRDAGLGEVRVQPLASDPDAKGPALFVASGRRGAPDERAQRHVRG